MSQELLKAVDSLTIKMQTLLEKYDFLQAENNVLRNHFNEMQFKLQQKEHTVLELEQELRTLKVAKTIQGSEEYSKETNKKINTLIKEIDWCIEQLSD